MANSRWVLSIILLLVLAVSVHAQGGTQQTSSRLEKHMDGLDAKFDSLQRDVLRGYGLRDREPIGRARSINKP